MTRAASPPHATAHFRCREHPGASRVRPKKTEAKRFDTMAGHWPQNLDHFPFQQSQTSQSSQWPSPDPQAFWKLLCPKKRPCWHASKPPNSETIEGKAVAVAVAVTLVTMLMTFMTMLTMLMTRLFLTNKMASSHAKCFKSQPLLSRKCKNWCCKASSKKIRFQTKTFCKNKRI